MPLEKLNVSAGNKILFLTMRITLAGSVRDVYQFVVTNTIFADGVLNKNTCINDQVFEPKSLYCEITAALRTRRDWLLK